MKKAQGLPLTTIAIAVIVFIVLFVLVLFFTGAFGKISGQSQAATSTSDSWVIAANTKCSQWCLQAQNLDSTAQATSNFCTRHYFELNGNGKQDADENLRCQDSPISAACTGVSANCP